MWFILTVFITPGVSLDDIFKFEVATMTWTELAVRGTAPSPRTFHGFTSAGGKLFLHGGILAGIVYPGYSIVINRQYVIELRLLLFEP
jgi:hypothetical protein